MITHLLKKDIRRSRVLLAMWFLLIVAQFALTGSGANPSDRAMQAAFQMIAVLVPFFQTLLLIVIIPHVVHEEPLVGTTAFWFTRPISPSLLLKSKALFALLLLVLLPLLTEVIVLAANRVTAHDIALAVPEIVMGQLVLIISIALIAVMTRNFGRFAIAGAGVLIAWVLVMMALQFAKIFLHPETLINAGGDSLSLAKSRGVAGSLLTILAGGAIVAHQYLTRRTARSIAAAVVGVAVVLVVQNYWPVNFLKPAPVDNTRANFDTAAVKIEFASSPSVSDAMSIRGKEAPEKRVQANIRILGIPSGDVAEVKRVQSKLKLPNGQPLAVKASNAGTFNGNPDIDALEAALGGVSVVNADSQSSSLYAQLFAMDAAAYKKNEAQELEMSADIELLVSRYVIAGELPLKKGSRYDRGSEHVVVTDVLNQPNGVDIVLQQRKINLLFDRNSLAESSFSNQKSVVYLLVNRKRREAIQPNSNGNFAVNFASSRLKNEPLRLVFGPDQNRSRLLPEINEQWLADAVLVRLARVPVAEFTRQLTDEKFVMNGNAWNKSHKARSSDASEGPDKAALAKIQLPENATKQQVKEYVFAVMVASKKQNSRSDRDPQVDMLAKVGAENMDVLIDAANKQKYGASFYVWEAVKKLARPEDKEIILAALPAEHSLVSLVLKYGWAADAKEILLSALADEKSSLPLGWIKAVATLQDPSTYSDLTKYFVRRDGNRRDVFNAIKDLPGIDLTDAVAESWKRAKFHSESDILEMSPIAAEYGNIEALDAAVKLLKSDSKNNYERKRASEILRKFTPATGNDPALLAWHDANRANLAFDAASKKFIPKP
ncbi:MAG: hypothetical protein WCO68_00185 [Verrucomicrobiota bacterium]